jgi:SPP1 family predicted phage head-tail adaptor
MRAGELDRKIVIEQASETPDTIGTVIKTWSTFATVWAKRTPLRGREYFSAAQKGAEKDFTYRLRWLSGLTEKMRLVDDGEYWDIQHIAPIGRQEGLDVIVRVHRG